MNRVPIKKVDCYFWLSNENMFYHIPFNAISLLEVRSQPVDRLEETHIVLGIRIADKKLYDAFHRTLYYMVKPFHCLIAYTRDITDEILVRNIVLDKIPAYITGNNLFYETKLDFVGTERPINVNTIYGNIR